MKILIFYQYFGTPRGGWSTRYFEFTRRWVKAGHEVTVVTSPYYKSDIKANGFVSRQKVEGIQLIIVDSPDSNKASFAKRAWNAMRFAAVSCFYALKEPHDLVLASSGPITTAVPALLSKWIRNKKMVFEVRDLWPSGGIEMGKLSNPLIIKMSLGFERMIYKNSDLVVACSIGMQEGVKSVNPYIYSIVIPNSSDVELFSLQSELPSLPPGFELALPTLLYAGSLGEMDDCSQILNGLELVKEPFQMVFVGDGAEREKLEILSVKLGLRGRVFFLGLIPKTEVVKWFGLAKVSFVTFRNLSVLSTSSPNKLFDSFAAGVPIIQTTKGWIAELVDREKCGFNADPENPESLASAVRDALRDPNRLDLMRAQALSLAKGPFNRENLANDYRSALEKLYQ